MTTITGSVRTLKTNALPGAQLRWEYQSAPAVVGGQLVSSIDDVVTLVDVLGQFSQVLTAGVYQLTIDGNPSDRWMVAVPDDSLTYDISDTGIIISDISEIPAAPDAAAMAVRARLIEITSAEGYELTAVNYDSDGVVTTATVLWSDGSAGVFTTTVKNPTFLAVDAYTISHFDSGKTVTQSAVTRNANGQVTVKPALTVA